MSTADAQPLGRAVYLETFGCQMNELDSELVRDQLSALGYRFVDHDADADIVLYNTCSVREHAENKAYSRIGLVGQRKRAGERVILGVLGCMAERDGVDMLRRHPQIDLLCGPGELDRLPALIDGAVRADTFDWTQPRAARGFAQRPLEGVIALQGNRTRRTATLAAAEDSLELLDLARAFDPERGAAGGKAAYVRITRGCNKFCTYCVVPNTRGGEVHRPPDHIVDECRRLADAGVVEITLLGQTVNHYLYVHGPAVSADGRELAQVGPGLSAFADGGLRVAAGKRVTTFAGLLRRIHDEVPSIARLRFLTSYPRDFGDDALATIAECPRICRYLHVPPQSGSDRILKMMNRGYSVGEYLEFVDRLRSFLPDAGVSGDLIVGFPTESDTDFDATVALVERVRFKNCFIFKYSPRPGTAALGRFPDDVPDAVKRSRNNMLLAIQARISEREHSEWVGRTVDVFVEQVSERSRRSAGKAAVAASRQAMGLVQLRHDGVVMPGSTLAPADPNRIQSSNQLQLTGRTSQDFIVAFDLPPDDRADSWLGRIVPVRITSSSALLLTGAVVGMNARQSLGGSSIAALSPAGASPPRVA